jgi:hypothetical protein
VPFVVPKIPTFSLFTDLAAGARRNVTPVQFGSTSRIGNSIYATAPGGTVTLFTAWGFMAGKAPPGTSSLAVAASGLSMIYGNCWTPSGYARAYADFFVVVEEFEGTLEPVLSPKALGHLVFKRQVSSNPTILINQETTVIGYQIVTLDDHPDATVLVMPITPGNVYRWWIGSYQYCQVGGPGWAGSNISFDFGPVFFAFA